MLHYSIIAEGTASIVRAESPIVSTMSKGSALSILFSTRPPALALMLGTLIVTRFCIIGALLPGSAELALAQPPTAPRASAANGVLK